MALPANPIRHYPLQEGDDSQTVYDLSANAAHGSFGTFGGVETVDPTWTPEGVLFTHTDTETEQERITIPQSGLPTGASAFTYIVAAQYDQHASIEAWQNVPAIAWGDASNFANTHLEVNHTTISGGGWGASADVTYDHEFAPTVMAVRFDPSVGDFGETSVIIDNFLAQDSTLLTEARNISLSQAGIGRFGPFGTLAWNGTIYYVLIYDRALSDEEITDAHNFIAGELQGRGVTVRNATIPSEGTARVPIQGTVSDNGIVETLHYRLSKDGGAAGPWIDIDIPVPPATEWATVSEPLGVGSYTLEVEAIDDEEGATQVLRNFTVVAEAPEE